MLKMHGTSLKKQILPLLEDIVGSNAYLRDCQFFIESLQNKDNSLLGRLQDVYVDSLTEAVQVSYCNTYVAIHLKQCRGLFRLLSKINEYMAVGNLKPIHFSRIRGEDCNYCISFIIRIHARKGWWVGRGQ